jgi:hypothetical protein
LSEKLTKLRDDLTAQMRADNSGWEEIIKMPEAVGDEVSLQTGSGSDRMPPLNW